MKKITLLFLSVLFFNCKKQDDSSEGSSTETAAQTEEKIDINKGLFAKISTDKGEILVSLFFDKAPVTVANFVSLAEGKNEYVSEVLKGKHYYDGLTFHRVEANFMIQGGDPEGTGMGGPGYQFKDEFHPDLKHSKAGILSMANSGPNTNGSQFFITHEPTPFLDGKHSVFGAVAKGQEVVNKMAVGDKIKKVEIIRKGDDAKKFDAVKVFADYLAKEKELQEKFKVINKDQSDYLNKVKSTASKTKSGLMYKIIQSGKGKKPGVGEQVQINYAGFLLDGSLFDSNLANVAKKFGKFDQKRFDAQGYIPMPYTIGDKASMIPGFSEAIEQMKIGDKLVAIIPAHLAYGAQGAGDAIPPNATIAFEIELLK